MGRCFEIAKNDVSLFIDFKVEVWRKQATSLSYYARLILRRMHFRLMEIKKKFVQLIERNIVNDRLGQIKFFRSRLAYTSVDSATYLRRLKPSH